MTYLINFQLRLKLIMIQKLFLVFFLILFRSFSKTLKFPSTRNWMMFFYRFSTNLLINIINIIGRGYCLQIKSIPSYLLTSKIDIKNTLKNADSGICDTRTIWNAKKKRYFENSLQLLKNQETTYHLNQMRH